MLSCIVLAWPCRPIRLEDMNGVAVCIPGRPSVGLHCHRYDRRGIGSSCDVFRSLFVEISNLLHVHMHLICDPRQEALNVVEDCLSGAFGYIHILCAAVCCRDLLLSMVSACEPRDHRLCLLRKLRYLSFELV